MSKLDDILDFGEEPTSDQHMRNQEVERNHAKQQIKDLIKELIDECSGEVFDWHTDTEALLKKVDSL